MGKNECAGRLMAPLIKASWIYRMSTLVASRGYGYLKVGSPDIDDQDVGIALGETLMQLF